MRRGSLLFRDMDLQYIPPEKFRARINWDIDGDTQWFEPDVGYYGAAPPLELRLVGPEFRGFNAPERFTAVGKQASARVLELCPPWKAVYVKSQKDPEKFGRWLTIVMRPDWPTDLATMLVNEKLGVWEDYGNG